MSYEPLADMPQGIAGTPTTITMAEVVVVNQDGTVDLKPVKSRAGQMGVPVPTWYVPVIGDRVLLAWIGGDVQTPVVLTPLDAIPSPRKPRASFDLVEATVDAQDASTTVKGLTRLSVAPAVADAPIAAGTNDPRMSDARTPVAHTHVIADTTGLQTALDAKAPLASPTFTGDPKAPTPATADNDTSIATTAYVKAQNYANAVHTHAIADVTGLQTALDGKAATVHTHAIADVTGLQGALDAKAPLAGPVFTGDARAVTPATADNDTSIATTAFVKAQNYANATHAHAIADVTGLQTALDAKAPLADPTFTGIPRAPTPSLANAEVDTRLATTAYVISLAANVAPLVDGVAAIGTSNRYARQDHVHPTDTSRAAATHTHAIGDITNLQSSLNAKANLSGATFTGTVTVHPASGQGSVAMVGGTTSNAGYVAWFNAAGSRLGYLGWRQDYCEWIMEGWSDVRLNKTMHANGYRQNSNGAGNLHLDAGASGSGNVANQDNSIYLNWNSGLNVKFGNGAGGQVGTVTSGGDIVFVGSAVIGHTGGSQRLYCRETSGGNRDCIFGEITNAANTFTAVVGRHARTDDTGGLFVGLNGNGSVTFSVSPQGTVRSSSGFIGPSDGTLKKNVENLTGAVDVLSKLRPVRFDWRKDRKFSPAFGRSADEPEQADRGFIAQEVETVLPDLVSPATDQHPMALNQIGMIPYLVSAIQEIQEQIKSLDARIEAFEPR